MCQLLLGLFHKGKVCPSGIPFFRSFAMQPEAVLTRSGHQISFASQEGWCYGISLRSHAPFSPRPTALTRRISARRDNMTLHVWLCTRPLWYASLFPPFRACQTAVLICSSGECLCRIYRKSMFVCSRKPQTLLDPTRRHPSGQCMSCSRTRRAAAATSILLCPHGLALD